MNNTILEIKNLDIVFGEKTLLKNFSLEVKHGEKVHLNSPSGTGKSSILKMILGFVPVEKGEIYLEGKKLDEKTVDEFREKIAYLSQKMSFRNIKVRELFDEIAEYKFNRNRRDIFYKNLEKLPEYLDLLQLNDDVLEQTIENLSGGEKQRIGFLVLALLDRDIWVLDEITSSLDSNLKEKIIDYILQSDKTVLLVSHDKSRGLEEFRKVGL